MLTNWIPLYFLITWKTYLLGQFLILKPFCKGKDFSYYGGPSPGKSKVSLFTGRQFGFSNCSSVFFDPSFKIQIKEMTLKGPPEKATNMVSWILYLVRSPVSAVHCSSLTELIFLAAIWCNLLIMFNYLLILN